jgi:hypothetical protein
MQQEDLARLLAVLLASLADRAEQRAGVAVRLGAICLRRQATGA